MILQSINPVKAVAISFWFRRFPLVVSVPTSHRWYNPRVKTTENREVAGLITFSNLHLDNNLQTYHRQIIHFHFCYISEDRFKPFFKLHSRTTSLSEICQRGKSCQLTGFSTRLRFYNQQTSVILIERSI